MSVCRENVQVFLRLGQGEEGGGVPLGTSM